jgi:hypothetical protein
MSKNKLFSMISILVAVTMLVSGCGSPKPAGLTDEQVTAVTENILIALDAGDYAAFTRDFSDTMITAFPEDQFLLMKDALNTASGEYISIGTPNIVNKQGYAIYQFVCKYAIEDVVVTVTFLIDGDKVEGLFFTSPNLIKANQ